MGLLAHVHHQHIYGRRTRVLANHLAEMLPPNASVLDVGTGDGSIAALIAHLRPDVKISGVDVLVRPNAKIPVEHFDGQTLPFADGAFEAVIMVDVLHHADDPLQSLREAARVASNVVIVKDHRLQGFLSESTLRWMDWVGNARHGVALPYNYWTESRWRVAFQEIGGTLDSWKGRLGLYWGPLTLLFDRELHFVARIAMNRPSESKSHE
jgi:ubiquinone/menaquinone biosynthesis C-methylase UbiE